MVWRLAHLFQLKKIKKSTKIYSYRKEAQQYVKNPWRLLKYQTYSAVQHSTYSFATLAPKLSHGT